MSVNSKSASDNRRWWTLDDEEIGPSVFGIAEELRHDQSDKEAIWRSNVDMYEGDAVAMMDREELPYDSSLVWNLARSACDTVHSEIAGRQKPMAKFQTSGADWRTKRRAKKLEKYCYAELQKPRGQYLNTWELKEATFLDAAVCGVGVDKVFWADGEIKIERHFDHELFVDTVESRYGNPQSLFHIYIMDRDQAIWAFAEDPALELSAERQKEIVDALETSEVDSRTISDIDMRQRAAKVVRIVEAWHLPRPDGSSGKHVFAVDGCTLLVEDWTRKSFPFVRIKWAPHRVGYGAKGLVEEGRAIQLSVNDDTTRMQERMRLCASKRTYVVADSVSDEDMQANEAEVIIRVAKGAEFPKETTTSPITDAELTWLTGNRDAYYETLGVSQMRASARKEPGVTAGVAIRTVNDMQTARFSLKAKAYENSYVELARQIVECTKEAADAGEVVPMDDEIDWKTLDISDSLDISIAPASALPNDPAGRLQFAQELFEMQLINGETFKSLLGWPDLEKEMSSQTAQRQYIEKRIGKMLDAEEGGENPYESPDAHLLDKPGALIQVAQAYFEAMYDDAPDYNLEFLRRYITELDQMIAEAQLAAQQAQAMMAPGGAPAAPPQ